MYVDPQGLRAGANTSYTAADCANDSANRLARAAAEPGIFGDFAAARSFHQAVQAAHTRHVELLQSHTKNLGIIGDKVHQTAGTFADMDEDNADQLRSVY